MKVQFKANISGLAVVPRTDWTRFFGYNYYTQLRTRFAINLDLDPEMLRIAAAGDVGLRPPELLKTCGDAFGLKASWYGSAWVEDTLVFRRMHGSFRDVGTVEELEEKMAECVASFEEAGWWVTSQKRETAKNRWDF